MKHVAFGLCLLVAADAGAAQVPAKRRPAASVPAPGSRGDEAVDRSSDEPRDENANETRERLSGLLREYPPSLGEVLRLDPSLLSNEAYLAPYPRLAAFLAQHPDVAHNPGYFVGMGFRDSGRHDYEISPKIRLVEETLAGFAVFTAVVTIAAILGWLLKAGIDYRRWLRQSKIMTEAHTKLLDRFSSNEDLLAYIQTPVGRRFLESAPIPVEAAAPAVAAPIGRILWSVQAGFVVGLAGMGLLVTSARLNGIGGDAADVAPFVFGIAMLALA